MKRNILMTIAALLCILRLNAQEPTVEVFKGIMNDSLSITLYLNAQENECTTDIMYQGMYQYNGKSEWLQLDITTNNQMKFVLVEYGFTGVLILEKSVSGFDGVWISPDTKRQLKVNLIKVQITAEEKEALENKHEEVNYDNYDC